MILSFEYKTLFIFCLWLWILSFLYYFNYIKFSPLYLVFFAFIFTGYREIILNNNYHPFFMKLSILIIELFILLMVIRKHFFIDKKKLILINNIFISLFIFLIYLLFLKITLNKTFYEYYFIDLYK
jgi:hypothetical protein